MRRQTVPDSKPRWLRQMVEPFADTAGRPDPDPPPDHVAARRTDELHELTGADTAGRGRRTRGHRRGTPDIHTRTLDSRRVDIAYADTGRSHRTPDTGHRTRGRDRVRGQGDLDTEGIPDRLPGRSRLPNCPLGRRTVDLWSAPSALGDGEVPASARLPTALPGACSVAPSARPSRALAHCSRVCWIWMVRGEGNGTTEGEVCGVGLVRRY
jgi:hypothetical protein